MEFGGSGITKELYDLIRTMIPEGATVVEFGAGEVSTQILSKYYDLYSIEHDPRWLNKFNSTYIYAPLVHGWYNVEAVRRLLPKSYSLILLDGPPGEGNRNGILDNLDVIKWDVPLIVDDTWRKAELDLANELARRMGKQIKVYENFSVLV